MFAQLFFRRKREEHVYANTWTTVLQHPSTTGIYISTAVTLGNGSPVCVGGSNNFSTIACISAARRYDPGANTWTSIASYPHNHILGAGATLTNGSVIICGGYVNYTTSTANCHRYDPGANTWTRIADLPSIDSCIGGACYLPNGSIVILGANGVYAYNQSGNTWSTITENENGLFSDTNFFFTWAVGLSNGCFLTIGGSNSQSIGTNVTDNCYFFECSSGNWSQVGDYPIAHTYSTGIQLKDGSILSLTGILSGGGQTANAYRYYSGNSSWVSVASYGTTCDSPSPALIGNGSAVFVGGESTTAFLRLHRRYD